MKEGVDKGVVTLKTLDAKINPKGVSDYTFSIAVATLNQDVSPPRVLPFCV